MTSCPHSLDDTHIEAAALWSAWALADYGFARVLLTPGDDTEYGLLVVAPGKQWSNRDEHLVGDFTVALRFGDVAQWGGRPDVHPNYAAKTWGRNSVCTGEVVARFLNALAEAMPEVTARAEEGQGS